MKIKVKITAILMLFAAITFNACSGSGLDSPIPNNLIKVEAPQLNPGAGTFSSDTLVIVSSATSGAVIYYTSDNSTPSTGSTQYTTPINISGNGNTTTIRSIAILDGIKSSESSATYTINYDQASTPQFSIAGGTHTTDISVVLTSTTSGAEIRYTLNGDTPDNSSTLYSAPIHVIGNGTEITIKAIVIKTGYSNSTVASAIYKIEYPAVTAPSFNPAGGIFSTDINVAISSEGAAVIYYTTNGGVPTTSSTQYTAPIAITGNNTVMQIRALAVKSARSNSTSSATYTINYAQVSTPQFSVAGGTHTENKSIGISTSTTGASIYYTLNGDTPNSSSTLYTGPINLNVDGTSFTLKAIAIKSGMSDSSIAEATYTLNYPYAETPQFSLNGGLAFQTEMLSIYTYDGSSIYYTTNGDTPTTSSTPYTGWFSLSGFSGNVTIKAIAVKAQRKNSPVVGRVFNIDSRSVYLLGNRYTLDSYNKYTVYTAFVWVNGVITNLTPYSRGNAITVSNGHYYVAGIISGTGAYWIDGVYTLLPSGNFGHANPQAIAVNGGTVYTVGAYDAKQYNYEPSKMVACIWVNNVKTDLETQPSNATGIAISGSDIYISGNYNGACYWKNGVRTNLSSGETTGIVINGSDVYISGYTYGASGAIACYWKNGVRTDMYDITRYSTTTGIGYSGSDLYISGSYKAPYMSTERTYNCIWKNDPGTFAFSPNYSFNISAFKSVSTSLYIITNYWFESKYYYSLMLGGGSDRGLDFYQLDYYKDIFVVE